jgi:hypothetical protein
MKIEAWEHGDSGIMVLVSSHEAMKIIQSISAQLVGGSPNVGRMEFHAEKNGRMGYFSIAVVDEVKEG